MIEFLKKLFTFRKKDLTVILLDDVFAELDEDRSARLLRLLDEGRTGQVILTVPKPGEVELRGGGLARWGIRNGRLLR